MFINLGGVYVFLSIKKYITSYFYRFKTRVEVDNDFYDEVIYLIDLEA